MNKYTKNNLMGIAIIAGIILAAVGLARHISLLVVVATVMDLIAGISVACGARRSAQRLRALCLFVGALYILAAGLNILWLFSPQHAYPILNVATILMVVANFPWQYGKKLRKTD